MKITKVKVNEKLVAVLLVLAMLFVGVYYAFPNVLSSIKSDLVLRSVSAAGVADSTADGVADNANLQTLLTALPNTGGRISILTGTYVWANLANVTRAINGVTIDGTGYGTYVDSDGVTAPITAGGDNWIISNMRFDAPGPNMGATTGWAWENVTVGATYYTYRTAPAGNISSGTNGFDVNPGADIDADLTTVGVTGSPKLWWDESQDAFVLSKRLIIGTPDDAQQQEGYLVLPIGTQGVAQYLTNGANPNKIINLIKVMDNGAGQDSIMIGGGCSTGATGIWGAGDGIMLWPGSTGTGQALWLRGTTATNGQANDSPVINLEAIYDADPTAGVTSTRWQALIHNDMVTAGASPKSHLNFAIGAAGAEATILELENNNGTLKTYVYGNLAFQTNPTDITLTGNLGIYATLIYFNASGGSIQVAGGQNIASSNATPIGFSVVNTALTLGSAGSVIVPVAAMTGAVSDAARDALAGNVDGAIAVGTDNTLWFRYGGAWYKIAHD